MVLCRHLFIHLPVVDGHSGRFHRLALVYGTAVNIEVQVSGQTVLSGASVRTPRSGIGRLCTNSVLNWCEGPPMLPTVAAPFYILISNTQGFRFSSVTNTCHFQLCSLWPS